MPRIRALRYLRQADYVKANLKWIWLITISLLLTANLICVSFLIDWAGGLLLCFGILQAIVLYVAWQWSYPHQIRMRELEIKLKEAEAKVAEQAIEIDNQRLMAIDLTVPERMVKNGVCEMCGSRSPHLHNYPYHPDAHAPGCIALQARAKALGQRVEEFKIPKKLPKVLERVG